MIDAITAISVVKNARTSPVCSWVQWTRLNPISTEMAVLISASRPPPIAAGSVLVMLIGAAQAQGG